MRLTILLLLVSMGVCGQLTPADEISPFSNSRSSQMYQNFVKLNNSDTYVDGRVTTLADSSLTSLLKADSAVITVLDYSPPHGAMAFADSSTVVALTQNTWAKLTGPSGPVYTVIDADDLTISGDTITITTPGDYMMWIGLSFEGGPSDVYHVVIYKNGVITAFEMHRKTSNNDTGNMGMPAYLNNLSAGDDISVYIRNTGDNDDATLVSSQIIIYMLHPR